MFYKESDNAYIKIVQYTLIDVISVVTRIKALVLINMRCARLRQSGLSGGGDGCKYHSR